MTQQKADKRNRRKKRLLLILVPIITVILAGSAFILYPEYKENREKSQNRKSKPIEEAGNAGWEDTHGEPSGKAGKDSGDLVCIAAPESDLIPDEKAWPRNPEDIRMLIPGGFHDGEAYWSDSPEIWYGLYRDSGIACLKEVPVNFERVYDPVLDMENEKTGINIKVPDQSHRVLMFNYPFRKHIGIPLHSAIPEPLRILPGDSLDISLPSVPDAKAWLYTQDYYIWMEAGGKRQQLLPAYGAGSEVSTTIVWAGDLDGDNRTDLIIDDIFHYNTWINYRLFLSSFAEEGEIVKEVSALMGQGC